MAKKKTNCFAYEWAKAYAKEKGITNVMIANEVGCSRTEVTKWFKGKFTPCLYNVVKIAEILECSVDDLIEW